MTQMNRGNTMVSTDRVKITVQAASSEIEDLVDVIIGRLEGVGLILVEKSASGEAKQEEKCIKLVMKLASWLD